MSCSKSATIKLGTGPHQESITLTVEKEVPVHAIFSRLTMRQKGHFFIVEAIDLGVVVLWDKGTRVYIKLDPRWKNKVFELLSH